MHLPLPAFVRLGFLAALASFTGPFLPSSFAQTAPSPRLALEEFVKDPARVAALKRGVAAMKGRPPSDPKSWFYQAAVHAVTPAAIADALAKDPKVAQVDQAKFWNQCPHSGQNSANFLIWHRAYVYYFERILREASGDPGLSLPYWNYTTASQRSFPELFGDPEPDAANQPTNPLYDGRREQAFVAELYELSESTAGTAIIFAETDFFGASEDTGLAGGVADSNPRTRGLMERQPHDLIHFAIGGAIGTNPSGSTSANGIMASVPTAAFDPIFWVHHANIDRLWTVWECLQNPPRSWGKVPAKKWLDAKPWFFNDVDGTIKNESRVYYIDRSHLAVTYDSDAGLGKPLPIAQLSSGGAPFMAANVTTASPLAVPREITTFVEKAELGHVAASVHVLPDAPASTTVSLDDQPTLGGSVRNSVLSAAARAPRRVMLDIEGLHLDGVTSVGFDVYVNLPEGATPSRQRAYYIGSLSLFGSDHHHGGAAADVATQTFDITRLAAAANFDSKRINVRIVPFDLFAPKGNRERLKRNLGVTYTGVRVRLLEGITAETE